MEIFNFNVAFCSMTHSLVGMPISYDSHTISFDNSLKILSPCNPSISDMTFISDFKKLTNFENPNYGDKLLA